MKRTSHGGWIGLLVFGVAATSFANDAVEARRLLDRELALTRIAADTQRDLDALDRARAGLAYTSEVLDHASEETLRRIASYRERRLPREARVKARARALYKLTRGGMARLVFETLEDPQRAAERGARGALLHGLLRADRASMADYVRSEQRALQELAEATRERQAVDALGMIQVMQEQWLVGLEAEIDPMLARVHAERRRVEQKAAERQGWVPPKALMNALHRNQRELRALRGALGGIDLTRPAHGRVVAPFGESLDPVYRIPVIRRGVELRARRNEPVRALAAGRVALVSELPGYGRVVVLDHGGGQYSLTGRLWSLTVAEGDEVESGRVLGKAAPKAMDDGLGPSVYLEIRHGEKPIDPAPFLRRARAT